MPQDQKTPQDITEYYLGDLQRWYDELDQGLNSLYKSGTRDKLKQFVTYRNQLVAANNHWEHRNKLGKVFCWAFDYVPELSYQLRSGIAICRDQIMAQTANSSPETWTQVVIEELKKLQMFVGGVIGNVDFPTLREHLRLELEQLDEFDGLTDRTWWDKTYRILLIWFGDPSARFAKYLAYAGVALIASPWWQPYLHQLAVKYLGIGEDLVLSVDYRVFWSGWVLIAISITLYVWIKKQTGK